MKTVLVFSYENGPSSAASKCDPNIDLVLLEGFEPTPATV